MTAEKTRPREEEVNVHLRCPIPGSSRAAPTRASTSAAQALDLSSVFLGHTCSFRCRRHLHFNLLAVAFSSKQPDCHYPAIILPALLLSVSVASLVLQTLPVVPGPATLLLAACCLHVHPITVSRRTQSPS